MTKKRLSHALEVLAERLHFPIALVSLWLILTSPWVLMRRVVPSSPGFFDYAHIGLGLLMVLAAVVYLVGNVVGGRWREYFPWACGNGAELRRELLGLFRLRLPSAGGAGLFSTLQGLLMLVMLLTALTGLGWFAADGSRAALAWREWHVGFAGGMIVLLVLHVLAAGAHLLDFLRD